MKKVLILILIYVSIYNSVQAQNESEIWYKLSSEITFKFNNVPIQIRWRPDDHLFLPEEYIGKNNFARTDIMLGTTYGKFTLFNYSKFDELGRIWTGARLDFNTKALNDKLFINIQERYFFGLNDKSSDHYYLVQYIRYKVADKINLGVLSYGKWSVGKEFYSGYWFVGPAFQMKGVKNFGLDIAYTKEVFRKPNWMLYAKISYKIKLGKPKNQEKLN